MNERRFESRFLCADLVQVDWCSRTVEAVLEDISALGACVQMEDHIPPGAAISISVTAGETMRFSGYVSYCVYRDYGYFIGIQFSNETRWSSGVFEPKHLTSLDALVLPSKTTLH
jgi:hypothetical protein